METQEQPPNEATPIDEMNRTLDLSGARVTDVKFGKYGTRVTVHLDSGDLVDLTSANEVSPDFAEARDALIPVALKLCEVPKTVGNDVRLLGVAFKVNSEGATGAVIKAARTYAESHGELALNTPVRFSEDVDPKQVLTSAQTAKVLRFHDAALRFAAGESAQGDLFVSPERDAALNASGDGTADSVPQLTDDEYDDGGKALAGIEA